MLFNYEAYTSQGEKVFGTIEAQQIDQVPGLLYTHKLVVSKVTPVKGMMNIKVKPQELIVFTRLLATAVNASIPLTRALEITHKELPLNSSLRTVIFSILHQIMIGKSLSDSLSLYPSVFSSLYVNMVKAGERSGKLGQALNEVLKYLQKRYELKKKISAALFYPGFILAFAFLVLIFFVTVLIPHFKESYAGLSGNLPAFTQGLLNVTGWIKDNLLFVLGGLVLIVILLRSYGKTDSGRSLYEQILLKVPVVGALYLMDLLERFTRTLSVLLSNGITLIDSLELVSGVVNNRNFEWMIHQSIRDLTQGESFTSALRENKYVPSILVQLAAMGEESGRLAELIDSLADFYEKEVDVAIEKLTSMITPVLIILIGIIIGVIIVGLFLPIFNLTQQMA